MDDDPRDRLRLEGAVRYFKLRHRDGCNGSDDPELCTCGAADCMTRLEELREREHADQGETDARPMD